MTRFTITAIKKDGFRSLAFDNDERNNYKTEAAANTALENVLNNNSEETIKDCIGTDLKVMPVECYESGDAKQHFFN